MTKDQQDKAEKIVDGLLAYLKRNHEEVLANLIIEKLRQKTVLVKKATVFTPTPLSEQQKNRAVKLVKKLIKSDEVEVEFVFDPTIIDGLKIRVDDQLWDLSLSGQIHQLEDILNEN